MDEEANPKPDQPLQQYPPDLINEIAEARRVDRVRERPADTTHTLQSSYQTAEHLITDVTESSNLITTEDWAIYNAVGGGIAPTADFIELARTKPEVGGTISPESAFAILALAFEQATQGPDTILEITAVLGANLDESQVNEQLDKRRFLTEKAQVLKEKAGSEWDRIQQLASTPKFKGYGVRKFYRV